MKLLDAVYYNGGKGPSDGNNYWRRFTGAHYAFVGCLLALFGVWTGTLALMLTKNASPTVVFRGFAAAPEGLLAYLFALAAVFCLYFATGRAWAASLAGGAAALAGWPALTALGAERTAGAAYHAFLAVFIQNSLYTSLAAGTLALGPAFFALAARGHIRSAKARLAGAVLFALIAAGAAALTIFRR